MNEKIYEFLDLARKSAGTARDAAAEAAEVACKGAADAAYAAQQVGTELLATAKVRIRIVELEAEVNTKLRDLGKLLYATHTGTPTESEELLAKLQEIDRLNEELEVLKGGIAKEVPAPAPTCPTCHAEVREGDEFCRECGGKL